MTGFGSTATRPGPPSTAPPRWVITAGSSRCATRRTTRDLLTEDAIWKVLRDQGITEENVKILGFACYSHHVRFADRWRVGRVFLAGDAAHAMPPWIGQGMCAGVRDVANLCWKLGAVLAGSLPESVLDTYQAERLPHVKEVTNRAVKTGKLIIQRNRYRAAARNHVFRTASKVPGFTTWLRDHRWLPDARYREGTLAHNGNRAVGWQIPQPWVVDEKGDDCAPRRHHRRPLGGLHTGPLSDWPDWRATGVPVMRITCCPGAFRVPTASSTRDGSLTSWLDKKGASVVVVRPDGFVYAGAANGQPLPLPPTGFKA